MSFLYYRRSRFRARSKEKRRQQKKFDWLAVGIIFVGVLSLYCILFPNLSGLWGRRLAQFLGWLAGFGRFLIPFALLWIGGKTLFNRSQRIQTLKPLLSLALFVSFLVFMTLLGQAVWQENYGGIIGLSGNQLLVRLFGEAGSWIVTLGLLCVLAILRSGLSPSEIVYKTSQSLIEDWQEWKKAKVAKRKERRPPVVPAVDVLQKPAPASLPPKIVKSESKLPPPVAKTPPSEEKKGVEKKKSKPLIRKTNGESQEKSDQNVSPVDPPKPAPRYESPSLEIFEAAGGSTPVPREELTSRASLLEQTLANFNIAARVVEIHPGPVITRYDLEPAPGVKVASISSRADDLALAMRSTAIRVLAPIPGKGAVGIEIPNTNPELVGLQEMLGNPEYLNHKSPLAVALGKTVSGQPYFVDLAAMPHILVAGATGSGKSVVIHALLCSLLYRMPPSRVKFLLIDPKRLELPSYTMIPHLYDPCHPPVNAEVITNSKQASKALARMVKVMEYRYDLFAKANVRNIESFNKKRKATGEPEIGYIVIVIDELADLMLTSPKEVEDSVQRLAQMARAVGIHLVLATQRPSVDVITGVIKANLPARIALRVASGTDSRVIVDSIGAESLLGNGDMLFLPPASIEPIRIQGAFVSEKEVNNLVAHVKQFGLPSYDDLFGSGSALEFAVEDKKELKDLIEALKLVLERRRVSQDLLKAHLGSSARATNVLSLLEVKEFIRKPEGSNRWEINFDQIEDFLEQVNRLPEEEEAVQ
ncbi:hypothetical protein BVX98_05665 [bacterium F11]|nr:hypothetical protein BVX98_05665 [bacterium F11]